MATSASASSSAAPPLLVPYRAVGLISDGVPFAVAQLGAETFVTTAIGRSFQVFSKTKLRLSFTGPQLPRTVTALLTHGELTIIASGASAHVYDRSELKITCDGEHSAPVRRLLVLGEALLTVCEAGTMVVWSLKNGAVLARLHAGFAPSALAHPATYLNKVLLGAPDGRMQLWNLRSEKRVHEFDGWGSAVLCFEGSPALDVMGIGLADGRIFLHNLKLDATVLQLSHEAGDAVTALAFRTDGESVLVSGGARGGLHVWDLARRARLTSIPDAHPGGVVSAYFVRGQAELLTLGSTDNALRSWAFDRPDGGARLLRARSGHSAPPALVRFHADALTTGGNPAGQAYLLSGGADRTVRQSSIWSAQQDAEYSQKREEKKHSLHVATAEARRLPPLTQLATSMVREREWANVLTCHAGAPAAYTWDTTTRCLAPHALKLASGGAVTAVAISACGHYGFVGGENGTIDKFNLQSGARRASTKPESSHAGPVRGIQTDALARQLYSASQDGQIVTWRPADLSQSASLAAGAPVSLIRHPRDSVLLAAACDDGPVRIYDMAVGRLVRVLAGHRNTVTDACWSHDGRWLFSASLDCTLRVYDVPSGSLIGNYLLEDPCTSLAVSPAGEYLATTHAGTAAICVWANRSFFASTLVAAASETTPVKIEMPTSALGGGDEGETDDEGEEADDDDGSRPASDDEQSESADEPDEALPLSDVPQLAQCITLSSLPSSHMRTLVHLDVIRARNAPTEPAKKPKAAPFFLPTLAGVEREFVKDEHYDDKDEEEDGAAEPAASGEAWPEDDDAAWDADGADGADGAPPSKRSRGPASRMLQSKAQAPLSRLQRLLAQASDARDAAEAADGGDGSDDGDEAEKGAAAAASAAADEALVGYLISLSPSAADVALRSVGGALGAEADGVGELVAALGFFARQLKTGRDFELLQALLSVFLRVHAEALSAGGAVPEGAEAAAGRAEAATALGRAIGALRAAQESSWGELKRALHSNLCMLSFHCRVQL